MAYSTDLYTEFKITGITYTVRAVLRSTHKHFNKKNIHWQFKIVWLSIIIRIRRLNISIWWPIPLFFIFNSQQPLMAGWLLVSLQCRRSGCTFLSMPECRTVRHLISPEPGWTKTPMPEPVRYLDKRNQSGTRMLRYRTDIQDAGMPMPSAISFNHHASAATITIKTINCSWNHQL
jgi:hypothetical protein